MRTVPVKPDGAVGTHDDHAVEDERTQKLKGKVMHDKYNKEGKQAGGHYPTNQRNPVLPRFENIDS
jgi:hypothetical protein